MRVNTRSTESMKATLCLLCLCLSLPCLSLVTHRTKYCITPHCKMFGSTTKTTSVLAVCCCLSLFVYLSLPPVWLCVYFLCIKNTCMCVFVRACVRARARVCVCMCVPNVLLWCNYTLNTSIKNPFTVLSEDNSLSLSLSVCLSVSQSASLSVCLSF